MAAAPVRKKAQKEIIIGSDSDYDLSDDDAPYVPSRAASESSDSVAADDEAVGASRSPSPSPSPSRSPSPAGNRPSPRTAGRAYARARAADAGADDDANVDSDDGSDSDLDERANHRAVNLQLIKVLKRMADKLDRDETRAAAGPPPTPAGPAPPAAAEPAGIDKFVPRVGQTKFGEWRAPVFKACLKVHIVNLHNEVEYQHVIAPTLTALRWTPSPGVSPASLRAALKAFKPAVQNIKRESLSFIKLAFRDGYLLRVPGLVHRTIPNAEEAPELARIAKREQLPFMDDLIGPIGPGFALEDDERFMFKFMAGRGTGPNAGRVVACGNPTASALPL